MITLKTIIFATTKHNYYDSNRNNKKTNWMESESNTN